MQHKDSEEEKKKEIEVKMKKKKKIEQGTEEVAHSPLLTTVFFNHKAPLQNQSNINEIQTINRLKKRVNKLIQNQYNVSL